MGYIYCITNQVNGKQYVGKSTYSISKRFKEHCRDSRKKRCENRPLYRAMQKYGIENFAIEELIQCQDSELEHYEQLFIEQLGTYHSGYNATKGGDGSIRCNYDKIIDLYQTGLNMKEVAKELGCCEDTVRKVIHSNNIPTHSKLAVCRNISFRRVIQIDKNTGEEIRRFASTKDAGRWLVENGYTKDNAKGAAYKVSRCINGKSRSAFSFIWKPEEG